MKIHKNRIVAGIILGFLILMSSVPAMAEEPSITLHPRSPIPAGGLERIAWYYTGEFEPNATLELFKDGTLNRTIISDTNIGSPYLGIYDWGIPLLLEAGMYQIKITGNTTSGSEVTNTTDLEIMTATAEGCRLCHPSADTIHHYLMASGQTTLSCIDCHPDLGIYGNPDILYEYNCLNCHNGTAFWANPIINPGEPHLSTTPTPLPPNIIITSPMTGDNWNRDTTQTIIWTYTGDLGSSATVELLEQGMVDQTWTNVPQANGVGSLEWAIPSKFEVSTYQVRVSAGGYSNTTGNFNIVKR